MTRGRPITFLASAAATALIALAAVGCGGGGATASPAPPKSTSEPAATVTVATTGLGKILVDSKGRTLYLFQKDSGTKSTCSGACASAWPPLPANGKPTVGSGAIASKGGTTTRSDGKQQVTYNGHPALPLRGRREGRRHRGQGVTAFGGGWYALTPAGSQVPGRASSSDGGSSSGGGSGY